MDQSQTKLGKQISDLPLPQFYLESMAATKQNPRYHAEGSVLRHTELVLKAYQENHHLFQLDEEDHEVLYWASILHDIGKTVTTKWEHERWRAKGHEIASIPIARDILLQHTDVIPKQRRRILDLVRFHAIPLQWGLRPKEIGYYRRLATRVDLRLVGVFGHFDILGRWCERKPEVLEMTRRFNDELVPRIKYEMGDASSIQATFQSVGLHHQNALWRSLNQEDSSLLTKLLTVEKAKGHLPQFECVMTYGVDSPKLRAELQKRYPHHHVFSVDKMNLEFSDRFDQENQIRQIKHFLSVYGQRGQRLLIQGLPVNQALFQYISAFVRQREGRSIGFFFEESLQSMLQKAPSDSHAELKQQHKNLLMPHPWEVNQWEFAHSP